MKLAVIGNYGATNVGDDAILSAFLQNHRQHEVTVFSANPEETREKFPVNAAPLFPLGIRSFLRHGFLKSIRALKAVDAVALGGGGLFQDDRLYACFLWAWQCFWVRWYKKPLFVYAVGVGPLRTRAGRFLTAWALRQADVITVRDEKSRLLLQQIGLNDGEIHVTADPAFLHPVPEPPRERTLRRIAVSIRPCTKFGAKQQQELMNFLTWLKEEKQMEIAWVVMQSVKEHDHEALAPFLKRLGGKSFTPASFSELLRFLSECEFAIGMRYHFLIASLLTRTPALALSYSPKVDALFEGTPLERYGFLVEQMEAEGLKSTLKKLSVDYNNLKIYQQKRCETLREVAEGTVTLLNRFLLDLQSLSIDARQEA